MEYKWDVRKLNFFFEDICKQFNFVFWIRDLDYKTQLYVSPTYTKIWGRSHCELYEHPDSWDDTLFKQDKKKLKKAIQLRKNRVANMLYYRISKPNTNNETVFIRDQSFQLMDKQHNIIAVAGIGEAITSTQWSEEETKINVNESKDALLLFVEVIKKNMSLFLSEFATKKTDYFEIIFKNRIYALNLREAECLCYLSIGCSSKETAKHLEISHRTVETHLDCIRQKLNARNKFELLGNSDPHSIKKIKALIQFEDAYE